MSGWSRARWGHMTEWTLLALCSLLLFAHTLPHAWQTLNTDFPNYYLAAQLTQQGYDMSQAYDLRWLQREKDHRGIDQRIVGLAPITPFSTLFVWPLAALAPLAAKHLWLLVQLALLVPIAFGLRELTNQPMRRIALIATACFPLHRNLLYGQYYVLLLAMLVTACWAYRRELSLLAGSLIALATMTKIFPAVFLLYFVRKRNWRALIAAGLTMALCVAISIVVFGWGVHRYYLEEVLPWTLRGEALPPYLLASSSLSTLLHRLFVYEPQWNPQPWRSAPYLAATLAPLIEMFFLVLVLLLIRPGRAVDSSSGGMHHERHQIVLEWSALLCITLALSTSPASYNFTLLILPMTALCKRFLPHRPGLTALAALVFLGIGYPAWNTADIDGLRAILHVPRLILVIAFSLLCCLALARASGCKHLLQRESAWWGLALGTIATCSAIAGVQHQDGLYDDYAFRLPMLADALLSADPAESGHGIESIDLLAGGYRLSSVRIPPDGIFIDQLSFASALDGDWIEEAGSVSQVRTSGTASSVHLTDIRSPMVTVDGRLLGAIRDVRGRGQLISDKGVLHTPERWSVLDAALFANGEFLIAASDGDQPPGLFRVDAHEPNPEPLLLGVVRYPALSPDGQWLAYSRYQSGNWNLWLLDRTSQAARRITKGHCNHVQPAWEPDSKTLLYASDCGRALGFTALCRRRVIP